ncbi:hypothetical protein [Trinickia mobilis]|uniref:hypothetical protein n=1 Tax=Trinickia mobilis TaxID=2816356 RepID=UPI001A8E6951|nr:hypothetical protein [Trinickia mobilis]
MRDLRCTSRLDTAARNRKKKRTNASAVICLPRPGDTFVPASAPGYHRDESFTTARRLCVL